MLSGIISSIEGIVRVDAADAPGEVIVVCEHASARIPEELQGLGLSPEGQRAHIAWDPGALAVAGRLAARLEAALVTAEISRLVVDLNRPPGAPGAMPETSEIWEVPGNRRLAPVERLRRCAQVYWPFHRTLGQLVEGRLAIGRRPVIATVHSFTPVWYGEPREVELGVIHDADPTLALALLEAVRTARPALKAELNQPYSAADGVTHMLRLHAVPYGLANVMIEIRSDLIATQEQQEDMAGMLAETLKEALGALRGGGRDAAGGGPLEAVL